MATTYYTPGVYIEEVDKGTKPIQGVATSVTAFVGFTSKAEKVEQNGITTRSILGDPTLITNWGQYQQHFGSYHRDAYLPHAVRGFFDNGGTRCYVVSVRSMAAHRAQTLISVKDEEGGKEIPVLLLIAKKGGPSGNQFKGRIEAVDEEDQTADLTDKEKKSKRFKLSVIDSSQSGAEQAAQSESEIGKLRKEVNDTKTSWAAKGVDLDASARGWTKVKNEYTGPDNEDLDNVRKEWQAKKKTLAEKQEEFESTRVAPDEFVFSLNELPFWGERGSKEQQGIAKKQTDTVEVWKLHKQGREAAVLPMVTEKSASFELGSGVLQFDQKFLVTKEQIDAELQVDATSEEATTLFTDNSIALYRGDETARKGIDGLMAYDDVNLVCAPDVMKIYDLIDDQDEADSIVKGVQGAILTFCKKAHYPFAILDTPPNKGVQEIAEWRMALPGADTMHGALYYPWIKINDPFDAKRQIEIPPSGHLAGIYARSDGERGVHKAPANEIVKGAIDLGLNVTKNEQELLNPIGVNCIRQFPGRGIRVWGARTLAMTDPSWRYINVRRLFSYVEASVEQSTQWVVFEPNDYTLWSKVRRDVTAFLRTVWLSGALFGKTPEEAFYVKCDEETNLPELRDLGQMVCEIGMAPVKPAEFVIFRFSQWTSEAEI